MKTITSLALVALAYSEPTELWHKKGVFEHNPIHLAQFKGHQMSLSSSQGFPRKQTQPKSFVPTPHLSQFEENEMPVLSEQGGFPRKQTQSRSQAAKPHLPQFEDNEMPAIRPRGLPRSQTQRKIQNEAKPHLPEFEDNEMMSFLPRTQKQPIRPSPQHMPHPPKASFDDEDNEFFKFEDNEMLVLLKMETQSTSQGAKPNPHKVLYDDEDNEFFKFEDDEMSIFNPRFQTQNIIDNGLIKVGEVLKTHQLPEKHLTDFKNLVNEAKQIINKVDFADLELRCSRSGGSYHDSVRCYYNGYDDLDDDELAVLGELLEEGIKLVRTKKEVEKTSRKFLGN